MRGAALRRLLLRPRWILFSLLALAVFAIFLRLGFWQLDRLTERRALNARVATNVAQPPLVMDGASLPANLSEMEYRSVEVTGEYDFSGQVGLRNQIWNGQPGLHLLTPLVISGGEAAVVVDRGWIPMTDSNRADWVKYNQDGTVTVKGVIRRPNTGNPNVPQVRDSSGQVELWSGPDVGGIQKQVARPLVPMYIQASLQAGHSGPPYQKDPVIDLSEGPHLGYALQWFAFAAIAAIGYPLLIRRTLAEQAFEKANGHHSEKIDLDRLPEHMPSKGEDRKR